MERPIQRAAHRVHAVHALDGLVDILIGREAEAHMNPANHQHPFFGFDLAGHLSAQGAAACVDLARLQRAPEGPEQSTGGGGDDVVERGGV